MVVHDPADVDRLIAALGAPGATAAMVHHSGRPKIHDEDLGEVPGHDTTNGVRQDFGEQGQHEESDGLGSTHRTGRTTHRSSCCQGQFGVRQQRTEAPDPFPPSGSAVRFPVGLLSRQFLHEDSTAWCSDDHATISQQGYRSGHCRE